MPTSRLQLSCADAQQLTNLIANMIEDHLRSTAATSDPVSNTSDKFMEDSSDQRESDINPFEQKGVRLSSSVEHGAGTAQP